MEAVLKLKTKPLYDPIIPLLGTYLKEYKSTYSHTHVYSSTIQKSQNMESVIRLKHFIQICENRMMKPAEIVLRREMERRDRGIEFD
jgi:hypothetical protein